MALAIINRPASDFEAWLKVFERRPDLPQSVGLTKVTVWQDTANPKNVSNIGECGGVARVRRFAVSPELQEAMRLSGVQSAPASSW